VADDHPALVGVIESLLDEHGYDVAGHAKTGPDAVDLARKLRPPLALVDLQMPGLSGVQLIRAVVSAAPDMRILVYTAEADSRMVADVMEAGARGIVLKDGQLVDLMRAIDAVSRGLKWIDPTLSDAALGAKAEGAGPPTHRELQVIELIADGLPYDAIAARLMIGIETVRSHVRKASARLGAGTRTELVAIALRHGLIQ
jgi:DNA-binding NarL/FixJ family response regulator